MLPTTELPGATARRRVHLMTSVVRLAAARSPAHDSLTGSPATRTNGVAGAGRRGTSRKGGVNTFDGSPGFCRTQTVVVSTRLYFRFDLSFRDVQGSPRRARHHRQP